MRLKTVFFGFMAALFFASVCAHAVPPTQEWTPPDDHRGERLGMGGDDDEPSIDARFPDDPTFVSTPLRSSLAIDSLLASESARKSMTPYQRVFDRLHARIMGWGRYLTGTANR